MSKAAIATDRAPAAIGPYSQAVRAGDLVRSMPASATKKACPLGQRATGKKAHRGELARTDILRTMFRASLRFLFGDPFVGAGFQEIEGEGSSVEHLIVEGTEVKLGS